MFFLVPATATAANRGFMGIPVVFRMESARERRLRAGTPQGPLGRPEYDVSGLGCRAYSPPCRLRLVGHPQALPGQELITILLLFMNHVV